MSGAKQRLNKVEYSLTPKQAVLHWLDEARRFRSADDYVRLLQPQGEGAYPLIRLPKQVEAATRQATRGRPREEVAWAVLAAVRDVCFLFFLHHEANRTLIVEKRAHALLVALLASEHPIRPHRCWKAVTAPNTRAADRRSRAARSAGATSTVLT